MKSYFRSLNAVCFSLVCLQPISVEAFLAGVKAPGMGGVGVAYPQDAYAGAYNPAGTVEVGDRLDVSADWIHDNGHATIKTRAGPAIKGLNGKFNPFANAGVYNADLGINKTFCTRVCGEYWDWAVGLVIYNRDYRKTSYKKPLRLLGTTKQALEYIHETISPVFSLRLNECHTIGFSLDIHVQRLKVNGLQQLQLSGFSVSPKHVSNNGYNYSTGIGISLGWKWQVMEALALGLTFHSQTSMTKLSKYKGFLAEHGKLDIPYHWKLGFAYQLLPCATLAFDVEWINWHSLKSLHNPLLRRGRINQFGCNDGPGAGFQNQVFYRIGIDYAYNESWIVRVGFRHSNSYVRKSQAFVNLLGCNTTEDFITIGATYTGLGSNEFSIFYAHGFENIIKGKRAIPAALGGGSVHLSDAKDLIGLSWGYAF